jgi:hypothetical protein
MAEPRHSQFCLRYRVQMVFVLRSIYSSEERFVKRKRMKESSRILTQAQWELLEVTVLR